MVRFKHGKVTVVVPAYNEETTIEEVVNSLTGRGYRVIVVDDGSRDSTHEIIKKIEAENPRVSVYTHLINMGLGVAIRTGIGAALLEGADYIVTFDADGQHDPDDIERVCRPLFDGEADAVIGRREFSNMPLSRRLGNTVMNIITFVFYGSRVSDSQSGLRAFTRKAAAALDIRSSGYGVSSEIIGELRKKKIKMKEITIKTIYTPETISKGTNTSVGLKILFRLIIDLFRRI